MVVSSEESPALVLLRRIFDLRAIIISIRRRRTQAKLKCENPNPPARGLGAKRGGTLCGSRAYFLKKQIPAPALRFRGDKFTPAKAGAGVTIFCRNDKSVQE